MLLFINFWYACCYNWLGDLSHWSWRNFVWHLWLLDSAFSEFQKYMSDPSPKDAETFTKSITLVLKKLCNLVKCQLIRIIILHSSSRPTLEPLWSVPLEVKGSNQTPLIPHIAYSKYHFILIPTLLASNPRFAFFCQVTDDNKIVNNAEFCLYFTFKDIKT